MCCLRFTMSSSNRKEVERRLQTAQHLGHLRQVKYFLTILAVMDGQSFAQVALILRVHEKEYVRDTCSCCALHEHVSRTYPEKTVAAWVCVFCCYGLRCATHQASRPPTQTD